MPPKRKAENSAGDSTQKKAKSTFFAPRAAPAKTATGPSFNFVGKDAETIRLTTWNINGIGSLLKDEPKRKTFTKYLEAEGTDILILTETKFSKGKPDLQYLKQTFKYQYWGTDPRAGHAGTAILSKTKPLSIVDTGLPTWTPDPAETKGRYLEVEFEAFIIVGTYVPNAGDGFKFMDFKRKWNAAFSSHLRDLDSKKPVIWAGDFNCVPTMKDIDTKAQTYWDSMSGLSKIEREDFDAILNPTDTTSGKFVDAWRYIHTDAEEFTHASDKFGAWRLDSFILSERILGNALACSIRHELKDSKVSDHWPVSLDFRASS